MASASNGRSWFGNLCYQFNGLETDDMLIEEPMMYLSEKLMVPGDSFLEFCSDISDVLPTSLFSSAKQTLSKEEETTVLPAHVTLSNDVNNDHDSSTDEFVAKETLHSCVAQSVGNSERTVNEDELDDDHAGFSVSEHSSESAEKFTHMTWPEFIGKYMSPVNKTAHSPVVKVIVSNDVHEEKFVYSSSEKFIATETLYSCVAQVGKKSERIVNEDDLEDDHADFSVSEHSSEISEKDSVSITLEELYNTYYSLPLDKAILSSSARSTDDFCSSDSSSVNHELEPPNVVEPDQFLSDSDSNSMNYGLEHLKKLLPDDLMELSDVLDLYASLDKVLDCDVKEEDNEVTDPSYIQKLDESLIVVKVDESRSDSEVTFFVDSDQEETFKPTNRKALKKRSLKRTGAEPDEDESEIYDEDFSGSDFDWEFV